MTNSITIFDAEPGTDLDMQSQIALLMREVRELRSDIQYIRDFVQAKQDKYNCKRHRKEQMRLAEQRERQAERNRSIYREIIWELEHRPWQFMPFPKWVFSPKELEMVKLLSQEATDAQIAQSMNIKEWSVPARICAINKRLNLKDREELIRCYEEQLRIRRKHLHRRCKVLLSWLLNPPEGYFNTSIKGTWRRRLGKKKNFRYVGQYISDEIFKGEPPYKIQALKLLMKGLDEEQIATRLKIRKATLRSYYSEFRSMIKRVAGVTLSSNEDLVERFKKHPLLR